MSREVNVLKSCVHFWDADATRDWDCRLYSVIFKNGAPRAKPVVPKKRPQGANIPYQRTNSPTGRTRGPLGSG
jgi:hypothetical protein